MSKRQSTARDVVVQTKKRPVTTQGRGKPKLPPALIAPPTKSKAKPSLAVVPKAEKPVDIIHEIVPYSREMIVSLFSQFRKGNETRFRALIKPALAKKLLPANVGNRPLLETSVHLLARALSQGEWMENGDAIRFDKTGRMLDGQHRLHAAIEADLPFQTDVVIDLDPASQATMDAGRRRTVGDNLSMMGVKYPNNVGAMMRWLFLIVEDRRNYRTSTLEVQKLLARYPQINDSVQLVCKNSKSKGQHTNMIAVVHFLASTFMNQKDRADAFVHVFTTGYPDYDNDPAHKLREDILHMRGAQNGVTYKAATLCNMVVQAYNHFADKKPPPRTKVPTESIKLRNLDISSVDLS